MRGSNAPVIIIFVTASLSSERQTHEHDYWTLERLVTRRVTHCSPCKKFKHVNPNIPQRQLNQSFPFLNPVSNGVTSASVLLCDTAVCSFCMPKKWYKCVIIKYAERSTRCVTLNLPSVSSNVGVLEKTKLALTGFCLQQNKIADDPKCSGGVNPKGAGRKGAHLKDVYGDVTPKEKCTCRVRAHGGG